jgi:hypothetical protein
MAEQGSGSATGRSAVEEVGLFASESLFVSFDFTKDAMLSAGARYMDAVRSGQYLEMPSEIKTYVHELTHYIQYTTTPYGLFLQYCRVMQSRATMMIVHALLEAGIPFDIPLIQNVPVLTGDTAATVNRLLSLWLNVENLVATLHGDRQRSQELLEAFLADSDRVAAGQSPLLPPLFDLQRTFVMVQESLADLLEQINEEALGAGNPVPMELAGFDREALRQEMAAISSDSDRRLLRTQEALDLLGDPISVEALIESAATAAEFWGTDSSYDSFVAWANAEVDPELRVYRTCIAQGLSAIQTRELPEFILSYMALCELALYAPLLPHHAALRMQKPDLAQILPIHRWKELIRVASEVAPMRGKEDYARYATDICQKLNWVHPFQIVKVALDGPGTVSNPLAMIYLWAQQWRGRSLSTFLGVNQFLFDTSPAASTWRDCFNFVILDYTDRTNYHPNKQFLESMTTRNLNMLGLRCIMLNKDLRIAAPYRGGPDERRWMTEWLQNRFKQLFDRDFPSLRFE